LWNNRQVKAMRTDNARAIQLRDYRPPDYLIDDVELVFELLESSTRVTSKLAIRKNPASESVDPPLKLDGEGVRLQAIELDQHPLDEEAYLLDDKSLTIHHVPERFTLTTEVIIYPQQIGVIRVHSSRDPLGDERQQRFDCLLSDESQLSFF
jgi:aminopeptidase N